MIYESLAIRQFSQFPSRGSQQPFCQYMVHDRAYMWTSSLCTHSGLCVPHHGFRSLWGHRSVRTTLWTTSTANTMSWQPWETSAVCRGCISNYNSILEDAKKFCFSLLKVVPLFFSTPHSHSKSKSFFPDPLIYSRTEALKLL